MRHKFNRKKSKQKIIELKKFYNKSTSLSIQH